VTNLPRGPLGLSAADQALLDRRFDTDDPSALAGLVERLPDGVREPEIEYRYDLNGHARDRLYCAHCHGHRHLKGFVVRVGEERALLGHNCGQKAFGFLWDEVEAQFQADVDRQYDLRRFTAIEPLLSDFVAELTSLQSLGREPTDLIRTLMRDFGKIGQRLARAARDAGRLEVVYEYRDTAAEMATARKHVPILVREYENASMPKHRRIAHRRLEDWIVANAQEWRTENRVIGRCAGTRLLSGGLPGPHLATALQLAAKASKLASNISDRNLRASLIAVQDAVEEATDGIDDLRGLDEFTSIENLDLIASWVNNTQTLPYTLNRVGRLLLDERSGKRFGVGEDWQLPGFPVLSRVKDALSASFA
jgi:hypothetical protein